MSVVGVPQTKEISSMLPEILKQVGPAQYGFLKDLIEKQATGAGAGAAAEDSDDVPPLVEGNFDTAAAK